MLVEEALVARLTNYASVAAIVGTRVYPEQSPAALALFPPQASTPAYITYRVVNETELYGQGGVLLGGTPILYDLLLFAGKNGAAYRTLKNLKLAVRDCLSGYRGVISLNGDTLRIQAAFLSDYRDVSLAPAEGEQFGIRQGSYELKMHFEQAAPAL